MQKSNKLENCTGRRRRIPARLRLLVERSRETPPVERPKLLSREEFYGLVNLFDLRDVFQVRYE